MNESEFKMAFTKYMQGRGGVCSSSIIDFEWHLFRKFQGDLCRRVGFEEYYYTVESAWLDIIEDTKPRRKRRAAMKTG